jgi:hypothetical protein
VRQKEKETKRKLLKERWNRIYSLLRSRDSAVGIATGYGLDDRGVGVRVPVGSRIFSSPRRPDRLWGPPNLLSNGYRGALSPGVKRPGRYADHSPPANAEVKKMLIYTFSPPSLQPVAIPTALSRVLLLLYTPLKSSLENITIPVSTYGPKRFHIEPVFYTVIVIMVTFKSRFH